MSKIFHSRIQRSLADENLQAALEANAERRIRGRDIAFASLAEPQTQRHRAHLVRAEVIEHLDVYLETFIQNAKNNGMKVHYAADANQALQIILEIARQQGAKLIAKSKTMVSEEIKLNHALESGNFKVVETDLGEYIVQLRGETPSHIITPAVHLRRQDVGKLFEEKLGLAYTEDISRMTNAARQILRQVFLDADIGISGVNFGVAESGTLCIVTNEGNGRMVTTIPRTHVAIMGIERLVPTMDDLGLMLSLLPRSATGQKLSVYTSLINAPRQVNDPDGPSERHIVLVDNGRMDVRKSELKEILYCIRCGACLNVCPVFRKIGGHAYVGLSGEGSAYPGPVGSIVSPALFGQREFGQLARASSLCGACREACPVNIDLPKLLLRVRAGMSTKQGRDQAKSNAPKMLKIGLWLYTIAATSPKRFHAIQRLAGMANSLLKITRENDPWLHLPAISGWGVSKDFPSPTTKPFHERYSTQYKDVVNELPIPINVKVDSLLNEAVKTDEPTARPDLASWFGVELDALGGKFVLCEEGEVLHTILEILSKRGIDEILSWEDKLLPSNLIQKLSGSGVRIVHPTGENILRCSQVRAGLTGAAAGIADTGSLMLVGGVGRPLITSLLPEIHIALLQEKDLYHHLEPVLQMKAVREAPAAVLITGPSRTADIEMTLTIGVHGPGELYVICIKNE